MLRASGEGLLSLTLWIKVVLSMKVTVTPNTSPVPPAVEDINYRFEILTQPDALFNGSQGFIFISKLSVRMCVKFGVSSSSTRIHDFQSLGQNFCKYCLHFRGVFVFDNLRSVHVLSPWPVFLMRYTHTRGFYVETVEVFIEKMNVFSFLDGPEEGRVGEMKNCCLTVIGFGACAWSPLEWAA